MDNLWKAKRTDRFGLKKKQIVRQEKECLFVKNESCPISI
jgi:hypothetical protein